MVIIRCSGCDAPIGVLQQFDAAELVQQAAMVLGNKIDRLIQDVDGLRKEVDSLKSRLTP